MSPLRLTYDGTQHATARQAVTGRSVATDACPRGGGLGRELSPGELMASGLAACMLFSMGMVALRDRRQLAGTTVDVDVSFSEERIQSIDLVFTFPQAITDVDRAKLERAAGTCPIKRSLLPEIPVRARYRSVESASAG